MSCKSDLSSHEATLAAE
jgi:hypothetical protein